MEVYVGNLSWSVDDSTLHSIFEEALPGRVVSATVKTDPSSGRSRGFGFVTFTSEEYAETAIRTLNGTI